MGLRRLRTLLIGGAVTALAITALGAPVAAADSKGTLAIVNGIPGRKVDVCLNGKEIKSGLKYGGKVLKNVVPTGDKNLKFFRPDPRTCRGNLLAQKRFPLAPAEDLTIVATRNAPKVVIFDNAGLFEIPPLGAPLGFGYLASRHAGEVAVNFRIRSVLGETPFGPAADPVWTKGDQTTGASVADFMFVLRATLPESPDSIAGPTLVHVKASRRYEWIFVGTNPGNTRFVLLDRAISEPTP